MSRAMEVPQAYTGFVKMTQAVSKWVREAELEPFE